MSDFEGLALSQWWSCELEWWLKRFEMEKMHYLIVINVAGGSRGTKDCIKAYRSSV